MVRKKPVRSRADVVTQLVDLFFRHGYNGTTLSLISSGTGLGRASLYHHFPGGKEEMARAVLEQAEIWGEQHVGRILTDSTLPAGERLLLSMKKMDEVHYASEQLSPASSQVPRLSALSRVTMGARFGSNGPITASCSRHFCASGGVLV